MNRFWSFQLKVSYQFWSHNRFMVIEFLLLFSVCFSPLQLFEEMNGDFGNRGTRCQFLSYSRIPQYKIVRAIWDNESINWFRKLFVSNDKNTESFSKICRFCCMEFPLIPRPRERNHWLLIKISSCSHWISNETRM
jgi:hypothetical protein